MDEYKLEHISDILFEHMVVGMIFYTHPSALSLDTIEQICRRAKISKLSPLVAIADLVSHGIISADFDDKHKVCYKITEFGQYFFSTVCRTNINAKELCEKVRGYIL